ncbi:hypothetical protein RHMOL_Rhmol02G0029000 [Rhododendron molle]|uniref:Uncharacterized protein n=1 Tax=Rhododendron molle TaxID=49168 RepID=A0ACC0PNB9_RHOML|nr:hypothetical protein RHMOL_Rhmol02G0029000 [Rhododendron molle]
MAATSLSPLLSPTTQNQPEPNPVHPSRSGSFRLCKNMKEVKQLHAQITKKGLSNSHNTGITKVISSSAEIATPESLEYAKKAYELYENDVTGTVSLYMLHSLIKGYSASGFVDEAILLYAQMFRKGLTPNHHTFQFLLNGCAKEALFLEGIQLHGSVLKLGLGGDLFIQNCLIQFYADCGEIGFGKKVFDEMSERDVGSWTCLICGCALRDRPEEAVSLFFEMVEAGIKPNAVTMHGLTVNTFVVNALIDMYMKCGAPGRAKQLFEECVDKNMEEVKQFHAHIPRKSLNHTCPTAITKLISSCAKIATPESLEYAKKAYVLYEDDVSSSVSLYMLNTLIKGYSAAGLVDAAISIYAQMVGKGLIPDRYTFQFVLNGCANAAFFREGIQLHGSILKLGLGGDLFIQNCLVHFYAQCREIDFGKKVFKEMSERDVGSWTCLICGCAQRDRPEEAVSLFLEMVEAGIKPNSVTMVCVVSACTKLRDLDLGERVIAYIREAGLTTNTSVGNALVDMYMTCGATDSAWEFFNKMPETNVVTWNTMIKGLVHGRLFEDAIELFRVMQNEGVKANKMTMTIIASACGYLGDLDLAKWIYHYIENQGIQRDLKLNRALAGMFHSCGDAESAMLVFDNINDVSSWTREMKILNETPRWSIDQDDTSSKY